jgi:transglutaminase-like putative cysteine protease
MILRATHTTTYLYSEPVSICHSEAHLTPRDHWGQTVLEHDLTIVPVPEFSLNRHDYFGNEVAYFSIHEPHQNLSITARSLVDVHDSGHPDPALTPGWEHVREEVRRAEAEETFRASEFVFDSPLVQLGPEFAEYGATSFRPGRPLLDAGLDLCHRIFKDFHYDRQATTVTTPVEEVLSSRHGVCQDFAHVMIACLRSLGIPARYVSGYLRSGENSIGAEASHAWASVFCSGFGWLDFDPTNDATPSGRHVTIAWGRDYSDVTPVRGVALGSGEQIINVAVEVKPAVTSIPPG